MTAHSQTSTVAPRVLHRVHLLKLLLKPVHGRECNRLRFRVEYKTRYQSAWPIHKHFKLLIIFRTSLTTMRLENFLNFYKSYHTEKHVPIKVAIIDNGVDITLESLSNTIIDGVCLVENYEGRERPWWLATDPHGTHMASFIHQLDPYCQFYIAKVCDGTAGMQPDDVAEVSTWSYRKPTVSLIMLGHHLDHRTEG